MNFKESIRENNYVDEVDKSVEKDLVDISKKWKDKVKIEFEMSGDGKFDLYRFLKFLKYSGDVGHSHKYYLDEFSNYGEIKFGIDGDDKIENLKITNIV